MYVCVYIHIYICICLSMVKWREGTVLLPFKGRYKSTKQQRNRRKEILLANSLSFHFILPFFLFFSLSHLLPFFLYLNEEEECRQQHKNSLFFLLYNQTRCYFATYLFLIFGIKLI
ncbi:MAG: hypothetical protein EXX96DRAFT_325737 [Benjaminiella poitrasii]|nr:MAG: hypothetical protein EXX96DRAFT_325737 [Benjaminiella poitrasii]